MAGWSDNRDREPHDPWDYADYNPMAPRGMPHIPEGTLTEESIKTLEFLQSLFPNALENIGVAGGLIDGTATAEDFNFDPERTALSWVQEHNPDMPWGLQGLLASALEIAEPFPIPAAASTAAASQMLGIVALRPTAAAARAFRETLPHMDASAVNRLELDDMYRQLESAAAGRTVRSDFPEEISEALSEIIHPELVDDVNILSQYHGTSSQFDFPEATTAGKFGPGHYTSLDLPNAESYGTVIRSDANMLVNPLVFSYYNVPPHGRGWTPAAAIPNQRVLETLDNFIADRTYDPSKSDTIRDLISDIYTGSRKSIDEGAYHTLTSPVQTFAKATGIRLTPSEQQRYLDLIVRGTGVDGVIVPQPGKSEILALSPRRSTVTSAEDLATFLRNHLENESRKSLLDALNSMSGAPR